MSNKANTLSSDWVQPTESSTCRRIYASTCREKCIEYWDSRKILASKCDVTFEQYHKAFGNFHSSFLNLLSTISVICRVCNSELSLQVTYPPIIVIKFLFHIEEGQKISFSLLWITRIQEHVYNISRMLLYKKYYL